MDRNLLRRVDGLSLSVRCRNGLSNNGIVHVGDLVQTSEKELLRTRNFAAVSLNEVKEALDAMGLRLGMELPDWPPDNLKELAGREVP